MKKLLTTTFRIALLGGLVLALGFVALPPTNKAISKMPDVKIQKGKAQQLESNDPSQLIELMARDMKEKQANLDKVEKVAAAQEVETAPEAVEEAPVQVAMATVEKPSGNKITESSGRVEHTEETVSEEASLGSEEAFETAPAKAVATVAEVEDVSSAKIFDISPKIAEASLSKSPWLRTGLSLTFVISVMFVVATLFKKFSPQSKSSLASNYSSSVQVLHNMSLGLKQQIMVILVEGHRLVVGVSGQQMNLLYAIPDTKEAKEVRPTPARVEAVDNTILNTAALAKEVRRAPAAEKKIEEVFQDFEEAEVEVAAVAKNVAAMPQNQSNQNEFNKKLEAFERYQADQEHIASLRQKVRSQMAEFSQRRETGEAVSANVSEKIRSVMRSLKTINSLNQNPNAQKTA